MTSTAEMMIANMPLPRAAQLLGFIDRHPSDNGGFGYAVLQMGTGVEVAWNGHSFRSLPRNWRDLVEFSTTAFASMANAWDAPGITPTGRGDCG
jgi:hypothetical protein